MPNKPISSSLSGFQATIRRCLLYLIMGAVSPIFALQAAPGRAAVSEPLVLAVILNGMPTGELLNVQHFPDGHFSAPAGELRHLRIRIPPAIADTTSYSLNALPGSRVRYHEATQTLDLSIAQNHLNAYTVNLGEAAQPPDFKVVDTAPAATLNYGVYQRSIMGKDRLAGSAEARVTGLMGVLSTRGLYDDAGNFNGRKQVRLDSDWRYINPETVRAYTAGDFVSNALAWNNSVRLAGFQWASAFEQRPDLVTTALPEFTGSAALPSTLDLFVNQQRVYSGTVPSGPFDLRSLPYVSGENVTLVATDATGRQVTTTRPYYYTARLLQPGLFQFSLDVGVPRFNYGSRSDDYDTTLFAAHSLRYGVSPSVTLESHSEGSADGLVSLGVSGSHSVGGYGVFSGAWSASRYEGHAGQKASLNLEGRIVGVQLYASTVRTFEDYFDLARVSTVRFARRNRGEDVDGDWRGATAQASIVDRVGFTLTPFDRLSTSLSYNRIVSPDGEARTVNMSVSQALTQTSNLSANLYSDLNQRGDHGIFVTLNMLLGGRVNAAVGGSRDNGISGFSQRISAIADQREGAVEWGAENTAYQGRAEQRNAYLGYRASQAQLRVQVNQSGSATSSELSAEGALLASDSGVFATNSIGDAYAIVKNAGPHVDVLQGGVRMATTDSEGRALLPNIRPYYTQRVSIDPATLPDGWEAAATEGTALAGYRQGAVVDFGARLTSAAVIILHDAQGRPVGPGYWARQDNGEVSVVGYDGELYVKDLMAHNRVIVDLGSAGQCTALFDYDLQGPVQPKIGPVRCK